jgi:alcohol dehydrogenase YqhD (iron-dependent ADH family)
VGLSTRLSTYGVGQEAVSAVSQKLEHQGGVALGERQDIDVTMVQKILALSV